MRFLFRHSFLLLLVLLSLIVSCTIGTNPTPPPPPPPPPIYTPHALTPFAVTVLDRSTNFAIIEWTEAINNYNSDTVKYNVSLDGQLASQNLIRRIDTLRNLDPNKTYNGRVNAFTRSGDSASALFFLDKLDGMIIFGETLDNKLDCFSLYSDTRVWGTNEYNPQDFDGVSVIQNDTVFTTTSEAGVWAFNALTGQKIWGESTPNPNYSADDASPLYEGGRVYTTAKNGVHAVNSQNGQLIWNYTNTAYGIFKTNPVIGGINVIAATTSRLFALNINTGAVTWQYALPAQSCINPVIYNNLIIFGGLDGKIYALNHTNGSVAWIRDLSVTYNNLGASHTSPILYNNTVIIHAGNKGHFALNAATGATIWNNTTYQTPNISDPTINGTTMYFGVDGGSANGRIVAMNITNGQLIWEKNAFTYSFIGTPIYVSQRVYYPHNYGITVYDAATGNFVKYIAPNTDNRLRIVIKEKGVVYYPAESGMLQ